MITGKLLRIQDAPDGGYSASNHPELKYKRWAFVLQTAHGEREIETGRSDFVKRGKEMIGQQVEISRGGKLGIMGGIRLCTQRAAPVS
jgi:hypothetical protein